MEWPVKIKKCSNGFIVTAYVCLPDEEFVFATLKEALEFVVDRLADNDEEYEIIKKGKE